jgi:hypothetical protein
MKFNFLMLSFFIWTSSAFPILRKSLSPNRNLYRPRFYCNSEYDEKDIVGSRTDTNVDDLSLEDLLTKLDQYDNEDDVPAELKRALEIQIQEKGKLTFQETLTMLGFNNFSFFIIGLSLFFIALNSFLGYVIPFIHRLYCCVMHTCI